MNSKKGMTLATLIVAISIMAILLGVIVYNVSDIGDEAIAMKFLNEVSIIETKVMVEQFNNDTMENYILTGTPLTSSNSILIGGTSYPNGTGLWYMLTNEDLKNIGVVDIKGNYIVNYSTGEVISIEGVTVYGTTYYTFEDVAEAIDFSY